MRKDNPHKEPLKASYSDMTDNPKPPEPSTQEKESHWTEVCYECNKELTEQDLEAYEPQMCCSGFECGCMGMPTEPPYCLTCIVKGQRDRLQSLEAENANLQKAVESVGKTLEEGICGCTINPYTDRLEECGGCEALRQLDATKEVKG